MKTLHTLSMLVALASATYTIHCGDTAMTIDAGHGARIISYRLGNAEVLSQSKAPHSYGSTFWTSPQKDWNWPPVPEYDALEYGAEVCGDTLVLTSGLPANMPYRIVKSFWPDTTNNCISVRYTIVNESEKEQKVAPWEISRVPGEGIIFFDAPAGEISPAGLLDFKSAHGLSWYKADSADVNRKVNANGSGWLAYANDGLLLVKKFQDLNPGQPAPDEAEIQVYVNAGRTYIEIESQGEYTSLGPGESLSWTVCWYLTGYDGEEEPSAWLKSLATGL